MKKYAIFEHRPENVSNHNRSTKGWIFHGLIHEQQDFYNIVKSWEDKDFFEQDNGSVTDQNGSKVFDPERPDNFDFLDYTYQLLNVDELNGHQIEAVRISNGYDSDELRERLSLEEEV